MKRLLLFVLIVVLSVSIASAQDGIAGTYDDPNGLYTVPIPTSWTATTAEAGYLTLSAPDDTLVVHALVVTGAAAEAAIVSAWETVGVTIEAEATPQAVPSAPGIDETVLINYDTGTNPPAYQGFAQRIGDENYVLLFVINDFAAAQQRGAQIQIIASGFQPNRLQQADVSGVEPLTVDAAITDPLEAFINEYLPVSEVPGVTVAIVQGGEIVYAQSFGVKAIGGDDPLTSDTHMMIGSVGKSLTTLMMATLVDDGSMLWDTPVVEILPNFAVADETLTPTITMRNMVCACTGVPRRDLEFIFNASELTGEDTVESLRTFQFFTDFGEAFQYSNQMVATGGYAAAVAAGGNDGSLLNDYQIALATRVLAPIGMTRTTLDFDAVIADGDYALPHAVVFDETGAYYEVIPVTLEESLLPIAPAGSHWSTANDMARYLLMELASGVAADGTRVVSDANLQTTWQPQISLSANTSYGLGWFIGEYKGTTLIYHGGNTLGFTADAAFLPEKDLGIVVLANGQGANALLEGIRTRLLELVFEIDTNEAAQALDFLIQQGEEAEPELIASVGTLDADAAETLVGVYVDDILGELTITLEDAALFADAGEFKFELRPFIGDDFKPNEYITIDSPLTGIRLVFDPDAGTITIDIVTDQYVFERE
ncbi:MAG: serine hydrolase domain-containing protein [Chloroflexota bacterium]|nr:serine hydrolase domain-containing protein [Chloroflexota bacterium]